MNLRDLINKLDTIEQSKLLEEAEQLLEKARIRYSDVEAVANQYKDDEEGRLAALTKLIKDNSLPGLFDPVKKEIVKPDGTYGWFLGADEATVKRLEQWGLLPPEAKTSSWLGARGEDPETAMPANATARSRDQMVDRAEELMKKAVTSATSVKKESIEYSLLESFGLNTTLLESITSTEHDELKSLIKQLSPFAKTDPDAADIVAQFKAYNEKRDSLITRINELINVLKTKVKSTVKESLQESKARMLAEGRIVILEDGRRYLRDGLEWTYDPATKLYSHICEDGTVEQLDEEGFWQGVGDVSRGVASGLTGGWSDNLVAGVKSMFKGTKYADELKQELATTAAVKQRSPWLFLGGEVVGLMANPLFKGWPGLAVWAGVSGANWLHNRSMAGSSTDNTVSGGVHGSPTPFPFNSQVQQMQKEILAKDPKALPKFGADGKFGQETYNALSKYPDITKKYQTLLQSLNNAVQKTQTANTVSVDGDMASLAKELGLPANAKPEEIGRAIIDGAKRNGMSVGDYAVKLSGQHVSSAFDESILAENAGAIKTFLELILKGGAETGATATAKAGAENLLKTGTEKLAEIGKAFVDTQGTTWVKRAGYWEPVAGPLKGAKNQIGFKSNPKMFANLEAEYAGNTLNTAAKGASKAGAVAGADSAKAAADSATTTTSTVEKGIITKFGEKAKTGIEAIKNSRYARYLGNHKFLVIAAVLATAGYLITDNSEEVTTVNPSPTPGSNVNQGSESPEMEELRKLLAQLNNGWPTDPETDAANKAAEAVGVNKEKLGGVNASPSQQDTTADKKAGRVPYLFDPKVSPEQYRDAVGKVSYAAAHPGEK